MTTSALTPTTVTAAAYKAWLRLAMVFAIVVFSVTAFAIGRATVHVHHAAPSIAPAAVVVPSPSGAAGGACQPGLPRC